MGSPFYTLCAQLINFDLFQCEMPVPLRRFHLSKAMARLTTILQSQHLKPYHSRGRIHRKDLYLFISRLVVALIKAPHIQVMQPSKRLRIGMLVQSLRNGVKIPSPIEEAQRGRVKKTERPPLLRERRSREAFVEVIAPRVGYGEGAPCLFYAEQFNLENESGIRRYGLSRTTTSVGQLRRTDELGFTSDLHHLQTFCPTWNN